MFTEKDVYLAFKEFVIHSLNGEYKISTVDGGKINYHITMNFDIEGKVLLKNENSPMLKISNTNLFIKKLTALLNNMATFHHDDMDYYMLNKESFASYLLVSCLSNMQVKDFNYPLSYLDKMNDVYLNIPSLYKDKLVGEILVKGEKIQIYETLSKNIASMEAPIYKQFKYKSGENIFLSPKIHHYIKDNICNIISIQNSKNSSVNELSKKLDRYFRKVDKGVNVDQSEENIKNISPNFLIALSVFVASCKDINHFRFTDYFPLRYMNKSGVNKVRNLDIEEVNRIQTNLTNRFFDLVERLAYHFNNSQYTFDDFGYLDLQFDDHCLDHDNIIYDFYNAVKNNIKINTRNI